MEGTSDVSTKKIDSKQTLTPVPPKEKRSRRSRRRSLRRRKKLDPGINGFRKRGRKIFTHGKHMISELKKRCATESSVVVPHIKLVRTLNRIGDRKGAIAAIENGETLMPDEYMFSVLRMELHLPIKATAFSKSSGDQTKRALEYARKVHDEFDEYEEVHAREVGFRRDHWRAVDEGKLFDDYAIEFDAVHKGNIANNQDDKHNVLLVIPGGLSSARKDRHRAREYHRLNTRRKEHNGSVSSRAIKNERKTMAHSQHPQSARISKSPTRSAGTNGSSPSASAAADRLYEQSASIREKARKELERAKKIPMDKYGYRSRGVRLTPLAYKQVIEPSSRLLLKTEARKSYLHSKRKEQLRAKEDAVSALGRGTFINQGPDRAGSVLVREDGQGPDKETVIKPRQIRIRRHSLRKVTKTADDHLDSHSNDEHKTYQDNAKARDNRPCRAGNNEDTQRKERKRQRKRTRKVKDSIARNEKQLRRSGGISSQIKTQKRQQRQQDAQDEKKMSSGENSMKAAVDSNYRMNDGGVGNDNMDGSMGDGGMNYEMNGEMGDGADDDEDGMNMGGMDHTMNIDRMNDEMDDDMNNPIIEMNVTNNNLHDLDDKRKQNDENTMENTNDKQDQPNEDSKKNVDATAGDDDMAKATEKPDNNQQTEETRAIEQSTGGKTGKLPLLEDQIHDEFTENLIERQEREHLQKQAVNVKLQLAMEARRMARNTDQEAAGKDQSADHTEEQVEEVI